MTIDTKYSPLVILGIDAGDPVFIQHWAKEGCMPTVASIMNRGCWGQTAGPELLSEHGVWKSLFSGISRSQHGYYYFRQLKPGTYDLKTVTGDDIEASPFWSYLHGQDKKIAIIDAPDGRPLPGLPGIQLANWATHNNLDPHRFTTTSEPTELLEEVRRNFGPKLVTMENHESTFDEDSRIYRQLMNQVEKKGALCRHLLASDRFDLIVIVFAESHVANHQFWKYYIEAKDGKTTEHNLTHAIRNVYKGIDREIGLLLKQLPNNSNVFTVSSVGMEDDYPTAGLIEAFCRKLGYQASSESNGGSFKPTNLVRRMVPESCRIALSRYLPREKRERLLAEQFRSGTNWRKTTAFSIPASYTSFIRVNLKGREPEGIVEPGAEYMALLQRIEADLMQLVDHQTNELAVTIVAKTVELFGCEPHVSLPDLFVEWKPGRFMQRVVHPRAELVQKKPDFYRRSDHSSKGFVAAAGPYIHMRGALGNVEVLNLAPTFLYLMDEPIPRVMTGQVIKQIIMTDVP
ncbi:MAG TPA: alkaline phosphatase family protein [Thermodesulfobacteriota bacterium]|nr:alkaline phosphatase family protein [Thermodesulfobacteriota bacterium]